MKYTTEYLQEKVGKFWDSYLALLELKEADIGKNIDDVPIVREMDIDENYSLRVGRNAARWKLVEKSDTSEGVEISEVIHIDNIRRGLDLLNNYLMYSLYSQDKLYE